MRGLIFAVAMCLGAAIGNAAKAESVQLAFTEFYPVTYTDKGQPAGPGVEFAKLLVEGLPVELHSQSTPLRRMLALTPTHQMIVAALIRTKKREQDFNWIGELYSDSLVMVTRKPNPRIDDLEKARTMTRIGVTLGGVAEALLHERKFTNVEASLDMKAQARKLASNRVEGWCALRQSAKAAWLTTGHDADELQIGSEIVPASIWIAVSRSVPPPMVAELKKRFAHLQQDGTLDRLMGDLR
ncbi:MAG TPA: transporter substrate-binding domain-containing protein [Magnetospirillaceae bacterium]|nr:transporter substrate-binding domain-containing protein [Magnetospirillaceae bacterium]